MDSQNRNDTVPQFRRVTEWTPAYNKIAEGYGRHGMDLRFVLVGEKGAIQFLLFTQWLTSEDRYDNEHGGLRCPDGRRRKDESQPSPADLGYHAKAPQYEDQQPMERECEYTGGACYYDGSGLNAEDVFDVFTDEGEEAMWKLLEGVYYTQFENAPMPEEIGRRWRREH